MTIRIILAGPRGKMGSTVLTMIEASPQFELVACIDRKTQNKETEEQSDKVPVYSDPQACFNDIQADVLVDFTVAHACFVHSRLAILANISPVIGTSGMTHQNIEALSQLAKTHKTGVIIAPNFSLGAVLLKELAKTAARFFPEAEVIEKHHDQKLDAPSGTASHIAHAIKTTSSNTMGTNPDSHEQPDNTGNTDDIPIHSVRLPGLLAHHEVIFGGNGESLTLKHDSYNRGSFMDGVARAIEHVVTIDYLVYGLEHIMME